MVVAVAVCSLHFLVLVLVLVLLRVRVRVRLATKYLFMYASLHCFQATLSQLQADWDASDLIAV